MRRFAIALVVCLALPATAADQPGKAAIASAHHLATAAGFEILDAGGNAFDAAVAVSSALAVVEPSSSGIGGGGFWLIHRVEDGHTTMIDGREKAPAAAHRDMYLNEDGTVNRTNAISGPLSAGIPGEPAALDHLAARYGRLPLATSLAPAIRLAEEGFPVDRKYVDLLENYRNFMRFSPEAKRIFLVDGQVPEIGTVIRQPDLASTLRALAEQGRDGFYRGEVARLLVDGVREAGGLWTLEDLAAYDVVEREPIRFRYRDFQVITAPPPSSGGVALGTMLNVLEGYDLDRLAPTTRTHLVVEAMRRAYRDRSIYLGDPDFVDVPIERLVSDHYAAGLRAAIRLDQATPSDMLPGIDVGPEPTNTTHFSLIDAEGNRVAGTLTVNLSYGSGFVPPGTGVLLNDEMDDFSAKEGVPNAYGLIGADANAIEPGKRPLSSMTPTFVEGPDRIAVLGTPGGSRIITMVLLGLLEFVDGEGPQAWVSRPRYHHQYVPDKVSAEPETFSAEEVAALEGLGHQVEVRSSTWGFMNAVMWDRRSGEVSAATDPRHEVGGATVR